MIEGGAGQSRRRSQIRVRWRVAVAAAIATIAAVVGVGSEAATIVWGGGTGAFGTGANWVGGAAPGSSDTASFDGWIPLPTAGMTATASVSDGSNPPANSIDGRVSTRWGSGAIQNGTESFKIDLGASMTFSQVVLDSGSNSSDYPRGYTLTVSTDNSIYTTVTSGSGSSQVTAINFTAQTARYIKISQTGSSGSNWWSIAEYTVYASSAWVPLSTTAWGATESRLSPGDTGTKAFDGDRSTRWSTGGNMANTDWIKVDMGSNQTFSRVEWDVGSNSNWASDYPANWTLAVSINDSSYTTITTSSSSTNLTNVIFAAQTARYIKISSNSTSGSNWWGIAEFRAFTPTQTTQLARNGWVVSALNTDGASPVGNAIDNNTGTRWATGVGQSNGLWFEVDMTQSLSIDAITMDAYNNLGDYPNAWKLETSTDNSSWSTVTSNRTGSAEYINYQFAVRTARYVRVTQTGTNGSNWWSIAEFNVYGTPVNASVSANATVSAVTMAGSATLSQASGNTLTVNNDFTQSAGTFTGGTSLLSIGGDLNLSAGNFTSTSGVLELSGAFNFTGGAFTHNNGRVLLDSITNQPLTTNNAIFYDLAINDGLLAYWKLDESASTAADSSGWARTATWAGSTTSSATVPGTTNFTDSHSISLASATNDRASFASPAISPITIAGWVNSTSRNSTYPRIVDMPAYQLSFAQAGLPAAENPNSVAWTGATTGNAAQWRTPTNSITDGAWYHIAVTFTAADVPTIYINGVNQTLTMYSVAVSGSPISNVGTGYIGNKSDLSRGWTGLIDDLRIYNRILSASEINSLYIGNQPGTGLATQTMAGAPTVTNDLTLASGTLAVGANAITVGGSWNNYGGIFTAGSGTVTLNLTSAEVIRSAGQPFKNLTLNGVSATWTLEDWLKVDGTLTMTNGALLPGAYAVHVGALTKTSGTFTAGTSMVVIDTTSDVTEGTGFSFNNLRAEAPDETGLVGYWKFDEGQGTTVRDVTGTGNNGTLVGNTRWVDTLPASIGFDNHAALSFNGTTAYAEVGTTSLPANNAHQTISAWVNLASSADQFVVTLWDTGSGTTLGVLGGAIKAWAWSATVLASTTLPSLGVWHHIAYTFDGTTHKVYVDGGTPGTGAGAANTHAVTRAQFGAFNNGSSMSPYSGQLDDVRIYNVTLTAAQIKNLAAGRYSGEGSNTTVTLGANSSASGALSIDSGTLYSSTFTMNASSGSNVVSVGSGALYHIGSATQTMAGGLTVFDSGTVTMDAASGKIAVGSGKTLTMNGTLNASSTSATIQSVSGAYAFSVGTTATPVATPTLNITGLNVRDTDGNGMDINVDHAAITTFTRFDNIAFTNGAGATGTNCNLQIYATSLFLAANGCSFDSGVTATVVNNVKLTGNGTGDGETRATFGNATCASATTCEAYDSDDDSTLDGVGDNSGTNGAVIQWIKSAQADTSGSIEGFPTAAFDWSSFSYYSTYVGYHDSNGTADRVYVRTTTGAAATATYYWESASGDDIIGSPRWDTVGGVHYVYVDTTSCKVYRLIDNTTNHTLLQDTVSPWDSTNNPYIYPTGCTITSPLAQDSNNLYWAGTTTVGTTPKLWVLGKTAVSPRMPAGSPLNTTVTSNNTAPAIWISGHTFSFLGLTGEIAKIDITAMSAATMNTKPSGNAVTGRITVIANTLYAGDDGGNLWSLNPADPNFAGTPMNWSYHDAGCMSNCQVKSHYVDAQYSRVYFGNQAGKVYVLNSSGATISGSYPYLVNTISEAFATAPLYRSGTIVIGSTNGYLFVINQDTTGLGVPGLKQTYRFGGTSTSVSGVAYDNNSNSYMVSTANAANKDGKIYYIAASDDIDGHL
ncbi:MAG: hypothetical protein QOI66_1221 [Myxococcales bacterium]|nr:hypothetical protein [Myxococcales bacterium]